MDDLGAAGGSSAEPGQPSRSQQDFPAGTVAGGDGQIDVYGPGLGTDWGRWLRESIESGASRNVTLEVYDQLRRISVSEGMCLWSRQIDGKSYWTVRAATPSQDLAQYGYSLITPQGGQVAGRVGGRRDPLLSSAVVVLVALAVMYLLYKFLIL